MFDFNGKTPKEIIFNSKSLSKLLFNGIEVWRKSLLPDGYLRCEYLESTGTQYIDLGYYPNQNTKVETNVNILSHNVSTINYLFGVYDSTRSFAVYYSNSSHGWGVLCGTVDNNANVVYKKNIKQKVEFDRNNLSINGTSIYTVGSTTTFTSTKTMYLFWGNGTSNHQSISRVYDFKIYENDNIIMNLIPALDSNGTPCMYDTVSGKTFYNQGTGTFRFKVKATVPNNYTLCDYLQLPYSQYFDTGIIPNQDTRLETKTTLYAATTRFVYGARETATTTTAERALYYLNIINDGERFAYGTNALYLSKKTTRPLTRTIIQDKNKLYLDGVLVKTWDYKNYTAPCSMALGTTFSTSAKTPFKNESTGGGSNVRIYYFELYQNDKLVQDLIPCLDNNGNPCFYDIISKQTLYSEGTGTISYGINPIYLKLKDFVDGFVNSSTGAVAPNSTYPRAISSPLVLFEKGKTYKLTTDLSATKTDDGVRFRIYGTDDTYKMSLGASQITTNGYATFEALDDAGKANFYVAKDILITPKQDFKARIMYIDKNYISEFKIEGLD